MSKGVDVAEGDGRERRTGAHTGKPDETCREYYVIRESFRAITVFMQLNLADAR
jgi:hypothetical protein